jgi:hypothetical protein
VTRGVSRPYKPAFTHVGPVGEFVHRGRGGGGSAARRVGLLGSAAALLRGEGDEDGEEGAEQSRCSLRDGFVWAPGRGISGRRQVGCAARAVFS